MLDRNCIKTRHPQRKLLKRNIMFSLRKQNFNKWFKKIIQMYGCKTNKAADRSFPSPRRTAWLDRYYLKNVSAKTKLILAFTVQLISCII